MKNNYYEQSKLQMFDSFCKKVLKNEVCNYYNELARLQSKEVNFSELPAQITRQLSTLDKYFATERAFNVLGLDVIVTNESIAAALENLPEHKRDIILLYYFLELSDEEISRKLSMIRSTVQYRRTNALRELKKMIEEKLFDEWTNNS